MRRAFATAVATVAVAAGTCSDDEVEGTSARSTTRADGTAAGVAEPELRDESLATLEELRSLDG